MKLNQSHVIVKRELQSLFISPAAYIILTIFLLTTGWFYFSTFFLVGQVSLRHFFNLLPLILVFTISAITMRSFSEEYKSGSYEILMTLPFSGEEIIWGKFLSSLLMVVVMILPTLVYPLSVGLTGDLDSGPVVGGFIGVLFLAASYTSIGILASSLTDNQIVAFIVSVAVNFFLYIIGNILFLIPRPLIGITQFLSASYHFDSIAKGVVDSRDIIYFISLTAAALYLTALVHRKKS